MAESLAPAPSDFIAVRVYAHQVRPNRRPNDRVDFSETLYWSAGIKTDPQTGEARIQFGLSDAVTSFRVFADAFTTDGALGQGTGVIESVEPFYIEPKLPLEVTQGDVIDLPVAVVNGLDGRLAHCRLETQVSTGLRIDSPAPFTLKGGERVRRILRLRVGDFIGQGQVILSATAGPYSDRVTRSLVVKPLGYPVESGSGGLIGPGQTVAKTVVIPRDIVRSSLKAKVVVYPTPLASMTQALERLIREPSGCFEQASSTIYPLVMAQQYFQSHQGVDPALIERSARILDKGYKRLISFECKQKGYEWFAADPGHEALTAYGVLEFTDMAKVRQVDAKMIKRTREWLLARRDGQGGFTRQRRALHTWIVDKDCSNAYITWALLESGETGLDAEIESLKAAALKSKNSYVHALAANVLLLSGHSGAFQLMQRLAKAQNKDGWIEGATTSIVGSGGVALKVETTALATLAWLREPPTAGRQQFNSNVENAIKYLAESCKAGRFGSTQSTVLALRAIVAYDKSRARPKQPGSLRLFVDGKPVREAVSFDKDTHGALVLPDITKMLQTAGRHEVELKMSGGSPMPYSLAVTYSATTPASADECKVRLAVRLRDTNVREGAVTEADVTVTNVVNEHIPMPVAIIGLPGGLEPRHDQLKELVKAGKIAAYEVIGREVVLYWRDMAAQAKVKLSISLVAAVPGAYTGPASRAYQYYTDEFKHWVAGLEVTITPR